MIELRRTETSKTFDLGKDTNGRQRYALDTYIGAIHYKDASGFWQDIDTNFAEVDSGDYFLKFTRLPYLVRIANDSGRRIYPDRNDFSYWIDIGKPFPSMGVPIRSGNTFTWDFPNATLKVTFANTRAKFEAVLKNSSAPSSLTIPFSVEGITRQGNELYHAGKLVAILTNPIAIDANDVERDVVVSFQSGRLTLSVDTIGLVYPITIDPTVDVQVGAGADDGYETESSGAVNITSDPIVLIAHADAGERGWGGFRFVSAEFPGVGTIPDVMYISFVPYSTSFDDARINLHLEELAGPVTFAATANNITARDRTEASVSWIASGLGASRVNSPSLTGVGSPAEELWNAFSPTAVVVITRPYTDSYADLRVKSYDGDPAQSASLHIEYTAAGGLSIPVAMHHYKLMRR